MPSFIIYVKATARVVVHEAEDLDDALEQAGDELSYGDLEHDESSGEVIKDKDLGLEIRCAQKVLGKLKA